MSIAEKLTAIAENTPKVFNAGYEKGKTETFDWLKYANSISLADNISEITTDELVIDVPNATSVYNLIQKRNINFKRLVLKVSNLCQSFDSAFTGGDGLVDCLEEIVIEGDTTNVTTWYATFLRRYKLKRIVGNIHCTKCIANNIFGYTFTGCYGLEEVTVTGTIYINMFLSYCTSLNVESAIRFIMCLADYMGTEKEYVHKISFSDDTWALLDAEGETAPGGITWRLYVANKGWNT